MKNKLLVSICSIVSLLSLCNIVIAEVDNGKIPESISENEVSKNKQKVEVTQLRYLERESGTDNYEVTMLISDRYIRIDDTEEDSGYIIYDDSAKSIYSVSHVDKSILVIKPHDFSTQQSPVKAYTEYKALVDAPKVSGKNMFNYRVFVKDEISGVSENKASNNKTSNNKMGEVTCTEIQLAEGLVPKVASLLQRYQKVVSGQQVKMVDNKLTEFQTPCYYADQVYNEGLYYDKGLPIQEWHSNGRVKALTSFNKTTVELNKFAVPDDYREFSVDLNSKRSLQ